MLINTAFANGQMMDKWRTNGQIRETEQKTTKNILLMQNKEGARLLGDFSNLATYFRKVLYE